MTTRAAAGAVAAVMGIIAAPALAFGQDAPAQDFAWSPFQQDDYNRGQNITVMEQDRPGYDALGLRAGGFLIFPKLENTVEFDSNALAVNTGAQSDWSFLFKPSVLAQSDWGRNYVEAEAGLNVKQNVAFSSNNELGWYARGLGRLDIHGESYVSLEADARRLYDERQNTDFPLNVSKLPAYNSYGVQLKGVYQQDRIRLTGAADLRYFGYGMVPAISGPPVDLRNRNATALDLDGRIEYGLSPSLAVFLEGSYQESIRQFAGGVFGAPNNSHEVDVLVGADFDITRLVRGQVGVGYLTRSYVASAFRPLNGPAVSAKIEYLPTPDLTVTLTVQRSVIDAEYAVGATSSPGYLLTDGNLEVDYALRHNVILDAGAEQSLEQYEDLDRKDNVGRYSIGAIYLINDDLELRGSFIRFDRQSTGADQYRSFDDNQVLLTLVLKR